jgi:hypothetical protein
VTKKKFVTFDTKCLIQISWKRLYNLFPEKRQVIGRRKVRKEIVKGRVLTERMKRGKM